MSYKASKSQSQKREGWCILFRHPLVLNPEGKPLRIRRGLSTKDEAEADRLVAQMNSILQNESLWTVAARDRVARDVDERIVSIFYDDLQIRHPDPWDKRDQVIPLKGPESGYSRVQLIGSTGAGKTTLVRQIIGSDPKKDRFPSTATAKTTVCDIEIMFDELPYKAVVSFVPGDQVRQYIEDCVISAITAAADGQNQQEVSRKLLEHSEQRFRLIYMLGRLRGDDSDSEEDVDEDGTIKSIEETPEIDEQERNRLEAKLRGFLERINGISLTLGDVLRKELGGTGDDFTDIEKMKKGDRNAFEDLLEDVAFEDEGTQVLIDDIYDEVESKFLELKDGNLERDRSGWPERWYFENDDRATFIKAVNRFSSNNAPNFGHLLTPIVAGLRVAGPFKADWAGEEIPKIVLMDGEGLGHTTGTILSLPAMITRRFNKAEVILLVDSATQPMQAGAQTVLKSVCSSGYEAKLAIAFTHFDQVTGDSTPDLSSRKEHVWASLDNAVNSLDATLGVPISRGLRRELTSRVFFLAKINTSLPPGARATIGDLRKLMEFFKKAIPIPKPAELVQPAPVYNLSYLIINVPPATKKFHQHWMAVLGLTFESDISGEHWARIKALSRRFAETYWDPPEYLHLRPVADLAQLLKNSLTSFISKPVKWDDRLPTDEERSAAVARVQQEVSSGLEELTMELLYGNPRKEWVSAFEERGYGSTRVRAGKIRDIYQIKAPILGEAPSEDGITFLEMVQKMFREAAKRAGAKVIS